MSAHGHGTRAAAPAPVFVAEEVVFDGEVADDGISEFVLDETVAD